MVTDFSPIVLMSERCLLPEQSSANSAPPSTSYNARPDPPLRVSVSVSPAVYSAPQLSGLPFRFHCIEPELLETAGLFMIVSPTLRELVAEHSLLGFPSAAANKPCTNMPAAAC